jgi:mitogen-activated protein kinase 8 interacting protein 1
LQGIFPSAYVVDVDYADFDPDGTQVHKERFVLQYLGSVETSVHKGEEIICSAVKRIRQVSSNPHPKMCVLEISDNGLHVTDKAKSDAHCLPCHDYFFALKNVSFCGFHPTEPQYLGFITKHPNEQRFACHVFQGNGSTRHVAEAIG